MSKEICYLIALLVGLGITIQAGANAQLRLAVGNAYITALISFLVGTLTLIIIVLLTSYRQLPSAQTLSQITWWKWVGGLMGVFYITSIIVLAPRIGAASTLGFIVAGQLIFSVIFDHYGFMGFPQHSISTLRVIGILLLLAGVYLIQKY